MSSVAEASSTLNRIRQRPDGSLLSPEETADRLDVKVDLVRAALDQGRWGWKIQLALLEYSRRHGVAIHEDFAIHNIELTNFCNLKCNYCPHQRMARPKGHMSAETLAKCIELYLKRRLMPRLVIHHFGEPLLHPELEDRLTQIARAGIETQMSTNGVLLEKKLPLLLSIPGRLYLTLSVHLWVEQGPDAYAEALAEWQRRVADTNLTITQAFNASNTGFHFHAWTGGREIEWDYLRHCDFLRENMGSVLWNGDMASCCLDCDGESVFGNINDPVAASACTRPWRGCRTCDIPGHAGYRG